MVSVARYVHPTRAIHLPLVRLQVRKAGNSNAKHGSYPTELLTRCPPPYPQLRELWEVGAAELPQVPARERAYLGVAPLGNALPAEEMATRCGCGVSSLLQAQGAEWGSAHCSVLKGTPMGVSTQVSTFHKIGMPQHPSSPHLPRRLPAYLRWDRFRCSLHSFLARCFCLKLYNCSPSDNARCSREMSPSSR